MKSLLFAVLLIFIASGARAQTANEEAGTSLAKATASPSPAVKIAAGATSSSPMVETPAEKAKSAASKNGSPKKAAAGKPVLALPPEKASPVRVSRIEKPPLIDGRLDDEAWQRAAVLKDFYQTHPGDNIAPS